MPQFEYLLIDSITHWVRVYRRGTTGFFRADIDRTAESVRLDSIGYILDFDALYRDAGVA